ncbi:hypothetical protein [Granulicella sp. WH15]|uniref:hypothetical protein n=1 Tax=Granulicella sp. WH15 TaxID=2602070 RepID=UPI0031F6A8DA
MSLRSRFRINNLKRKLLRAAHVTGPTLVALTFAGIGSSVAHAQGTMDFSGAQTLMTTFKTITFDPREMRHFDHGYAVTSHSSQGLTAERVLVNMDTEVYPELINQRFAYVSVSRASHDAQIFTNDAITLTESLSRDVSKASAIDFARNMTPAASIGLGHTSTVERAQGNGLGLTL